MLTQKDFKAVAEIIKENTQEQFKLGGNTVWLSKRYTCRNLADYFATQNPRFDRNQFMRTCGLTE